jgi:predicted 2-oxoglutarate/Fe(II)-dependent dioxygenase YbiX
MKLEDYVKVYKNCLSSDICDSAINDMDTTEWNDHTFYNSLTNHSYKNDNDCQVSFQQVSSSQQITDCIGKSLIQYVNNFNLPYFKQLQQFSPVIFHKYVLGKTMELHCDHIHSLFDTPNFDRRGIPILSVVGVLNDSYTGGKFLMFDDEQEMQLTKGDVIIFPSIFLYPHKVSEVTSGTRYSFVSWAW